METYKAQVFPAQEVEWGDDVPEDFPWWRGYEWDVPP